IGMIGALFGRESRAGFAEQADGFWRITQAEFRLAQDHLHARDRQGVADDLALQLGGGLVDTLAQKRLQRLALVLDVLGVKILEDGAQNLVGLLDLREALAGRLFRPALALRAFGFGPLRLLGPDQSE